MKIKQSAKGKLETLLLIITIVIFGLVCTTCLDLRNKQLDKKTTEMSGTQISQNKNLTK